MRIVVDSSANLTALPGADFASAPFRIMVGEREFVDDGNLNIREFLDSLDGFKGNTGSACPGIGNWLEAFGDAEQVLGAALTSKISGGYDAAMMAAGEYMEEHPGRKVFILDSHTTGPELELIVEKMHELSESGSDFDTACRELQAYSSRTRLFFSLENLANFVRNGRVNPALAKIVGMLGIRIVGKASDAGELEPLYKCRGEEKAIRQLFASMLEAGYKGGKARIRHTVNENAAKRLAGMIRDAFPGADITIGANRGLCSYYAETGGILLGFET